MKFEITFLINEIDKQATLRLLEEIGISKDILIIKQIPESPYTRDEFTFYPRQDERNVCINCSHVERNHSMIGPNLYRCNKINKNETICQCKEFVVT